MTPLSILFTAFFLFVQHLFARKRRAILKEEQELQGKMYDAMNELRSARHDASLEIALQRAKQATDSLRQRLDVLHSQPYRSEEERRMIAEVEKSVEETLRLGMEAQSAKQHVMALANKVFHFTTIYSEGPPRFVPEGSRHEDEAYMIFEEVDDRDEDRDAFDMVDSAEAYIHSIQKTQKLEDKYNH